MRNESKQQRNLARRNRNKNRGAIIKRLRKTITELRREIERERERYERLEAKHRRRRRRSEARNLIHIKINKTPEIPETKNEGWEIIRKWMVQTFGDPTTVWTKQNQSCSSSS